MFFLRLRAVVAVSGHLDLAFRSNLCTDCNLFLKGFKRFLYINVFLVAR